MKSKLCLVGILVFGAVGCGSQPHEAPPTHQECTTDDNCPPAEPICQTVIGDTVTRSMCTSACESFGDCYSTGGEVPVLSQCYGELADGGGYDPAAPDRFCVRNCGGGGCPAGLECVTITARGGPDTICVPQ